jgi:choline dehydrogenase-like flavoprotein
LTSALGTVLVVEYGYLYHDDPFISRPWRPFNPSQNVFHDPKLMFNLSSTPQSGLNDRKTPVEAGATVGGGSTVNGMFLNRGSAEDYNAWERLGNPGWGWEGLLPYFKKSVTFTPPGKWLQQEYGTTYDVDAAYGGQGPIHSSYPPWAWPGQKVQLKAWKEMGVKQSREGAGGNAVGLFWVPRAQDPVTQTRSYAVTGHLDPALKRENFELLAGHRVVKVMLSNNLQAEGVIIKPRDLVNGNRTVVRARKEVIIAAGFHSPIILQRSGIGPQQVLEAAGIDVRLNLPG